MWCNGPLSPRKPKGLPVLQPNRVVSQPLEGDLPFVGVNSGNHRIQQERPLAAVERQTISCRAICLEEQFIRLWIRHGDC